MASEAFFLDAPGGRRFCIHTPPAGPVRSAVLYLHPFAEEMNRARRMAALQARALAAAGHAVLQIDLGGCGDSEGEFGDATWDGWIEDALAGAGWLAGRYSVPLWLWGTRAGALVAGVAAMPSGAVGLLLVQPVVSGRQALRQFLRLAAAEAGSAGRGAEALMSELEAGASVEVAGYTVGPALARGMAAAELQPVPRPIRLECLEMVADDDTGVSPGLSRCVTAWQAAGHVVRAHAVIGPQFWQTAEVTTSATLAQTVVAALD